MKNVKTLNILNVRNMKLTSGQEWTHKKAIERDRDREKEIKSKKKYWEKRQIENGENIELEIQSEVVWERVREKETETERERQREMIKKHKENACVILCVWMRVTPSFANSIPLYKTSKSFADEEDWRCCEWDCFYVL